MSPTNTTADHTFYIGLCMAGAVSAGAYTAGVMDYLIEALQEWQKRKDAGLPNTPKHKVVIPVVGGASAGGMTGIVTAAALNNPITPVTEPSEDILAEHPENKLYHSWVDLLGPDMFPLMLQTNDIGKGGIISLLNSSFIEKVADRALEVNTANLQPLPPFFDSQLKVFTTLTNLQGFGYNVSFSSNIPSSKSNKYYMAVHNDYACFKMHSASEEEDGWMLLDFKKNINIEVAKDAAMATGAFPIGLQSRTLKRKSAHVNKIPWCTDITTNFPVEGIDCETLNVDGGVINNEPFEKVRDVLGQVTEQDKEEDYQDYDWFKSTVLLIDPFPSEKPGPFKADQKLLKVVGLTFSAMLQQMRAKPLKLADAMDSNKAGQFLIAPTRKRPRLDGTMEEIAGDKAIACGSYDGFGGFLSKEFRVHDYFLGRFNCEMFLRNYFTLPAAALEQNSIFKEGYEGIDKEAFKGTANEQGDTYQIIPIFTPKPAEGYFPIPVFSNGSNWPVIKEATIEAYRPLVSKRIQSLMINALKVNLFNKFLLWIGTKVVLNRVLTNAAMNSIKESLQKHQLMKQGTG